jgi:hypothetical protein
MEHEVARVCVECQGQMSPIMIMDKIHPWPTNHRHAGSLEYRLLDDRLSFWTGKYRTAGSVLAYMCKGCDRIALYGSKPDAEPATSPDVGEGDAV